MEEEILKLLNEGESVYLEFKEAKDEMPKTLWDTYSAFANTDGGTILLGIKENKDETDPRKRFEVSGVNNPEKLVSDFWNNINNKQIVNSNILMDRDVNIYEIDGRYVIKIDVPRASCDQKPIFHTENLYNGTYLRNHEGDRHATKDIVDAMIRDSYAPGNDGGLLEGYTLDDIDHETLRKYREKFSSLHPEHRLNKLGDSDFLTKIHGYKYDRETGKRWLTPAGLLMFGKGTSIGEYFDYIHMDYLDLTNVPPGKKWSDRIICDGSWENNLYNYINRVFKKITQNLYFPFGVESLEQVKDSPVFQALREAVTNMIIHADYNVEGTLKVVKEGDAFIFSNPGSLKIPVEDIFNGGVSSPRNPNIQKMFELIGYGDGIGSGVQIISDVFKEENWHTPDLQYNEVLNQVELKLWMTPIYSKKRENLLKELYSISYSSLNKLKKAILLIVGTEKKVTKRRLKTLLDLNDEDDCVLEENLRYLVENDFLKKSKYHNEVFYIADSKKIELEKTLNIKSSKRLLEENRVDINSSNVTKIFNYLYDHNLITTKEVVEITDISTRQGANKLLNRLVEEDLLIKQKRGRGYFYSFKNSEDNGKEEK